MEIKRRKKKLKHNYYRLHFTFHFLTFVVLLDIIVPVCYKLYIYFFWNAICLRVC